MGQKQQDDVAWLIEMAFLMFECLNRYDADPTKTDLLASARLAGRGMTTKIALMLEAKEAVNEAAHATRTAA